MIFWLLAGLLLVLFGLVVFRGAPYVPTHKAAVAKALDLLKLKQGSVVVDLGSGDGVFLKAAAKRGLRAVGYEINPLLCVVAWLRCLPVRGNVQIKLRDFWLTPLPPKTSAVFIFLAGPHMKRFARYLKKVMAKRNKPLTVVSYGFMVPGLKPYRQEDGLYFYKLGL